MFLRMRNVGIATHLSLAAGAVLSLGGHAMADGPGVGVSIRIGAPAQPACVVVPVREADYAGTLSIDGRAFRIDTDRSVRGQIRDAFRYLGYDAWFVGRSVRVRTVGCDPEVCWSNGDYSIAFRERSNSITLTPVRGCSDEEYGLQFRYGFDRAHGHYYTYRGGHPAGGGVSWIGVGFCTFVDNDYNLAEELHGVHHDHASRHFEHPRDHEHRVIEHRDGAPHRTGDRTDHRTVVLPAPRTDDVTPRQTTDPIDRRRSTHRVAVATPPRTDDVKPLPSDRVVNVNPVSKPVDRKVTAAPVAPVNRRDDAKPVVKPSDPKRTTPPAAHVVKKEVPKPAVKPVDLKRSAPPSAPVVKKAEPKPAAKPAEPKRSAAPAAPVKKAEVKPVAPVTPRGVVPKAKPAPVVQKSEPKATPDPKAMETKPAPASNGSNDKKSKW